MTENWNEIDRFAKDLIHHAGETIKNSFKDKLSIESKSNANDLVTNMDKEIEQYFVKEIRRYNPDHKILGEEGYGDQVTSHEGTVWIVDPIDGTMNFVHQQRNFAISIGIYHNGIGMLGYIYDVVLDELYHAHKGNGAYMNEEKLKPLKPVPVSEAIFSINATWITPHEKVPYQIFGPIVHDVRGTRSYGSAALELAYVAAGRLDGYLTMRLAPWDIAGGKILIEEVGGVVTNLQNQTHSLLGKDSLFAGNADVHNEIYQNYLQGKL
ncbi:inositol monophosphatase family protein [Jeotgalibacillus proteolyticus]|uniref:inositol-phosphate phosphatase n=1 Tax=Jeotgalibacillus proteolyticus TaxID=2082395 RepID=A0A2S5GH56_9BACL|nr:inositol monophosphatase family protein [Jeotgalibacillus proteolyticus]PPA72193.1 inositol monophosphatase [Jeotgalibacillus proteolyticus]